MLTSAVFVYVTTNHVPDAVFGAEIGYLCVNYDATIGEVPVDGDSQRP